MKILALDSSGLVASVAVVEDDGVNSSLLAEYTVNYKKTHSQTLLPMLDEIARMIELDLNTIDAIAVAAGPGSFTGLRIGSATAKGLGLALDKPLVHVPTVDALAYNLYGTDRVICPLMDARRNQVYTGIYEFRNNELSVIEPQMAVGIEVIAGKLRALGREVVFLGDGVPVFRKALMEELMQGMDFSFAPAHLNKQRAGAVAALAVSYVRAGKIETAAEHRPDYLRPSQAERERAEKEAREKAEKAKAEKAERVEKEKAEEQKEQKEQKEAGLHE
ncbi:tRNA (adenosine(37)-N6)-threonylcarbamoyltransferase complex dimerization subunit type 1 TsaB [Lachnoclostridium sp. An138]|uniref:tRNA (adenosine(37)-N6)-threonylcarbamoyltransferase complex dimerization subunit type 1 TsaB n=1 Tax=Lachnoclostridium sp. An138 TaxID=1965560 RepID=UPI000B38378C|nr:tRNA (adenosine(37)-N6)-threonylcarbamoyltransferase complex dimerization subunit type 1 TsaB [Lachnoclostridium sp. An138]OUQ17553.1 tRNA (adenosine(37)-N6)-threonylcarbamoyltransferase complex dimerization subunit type 1 TsaB [Lachnoclostridium sp. An138]